MNLHDLKPASGATKKRKRIGRGTGSGRGGTSTKGHKGAQSRAGYSSKPGFEGGQMPLQRRLPKFGFKNHNRVEYVAINLDTLQLFADTHKLKSISPEDLNKHGLVSKKDRVKVLSRGELKSVLEIKAHAFSVKAKEIIENLGGTTEKI